jgi:AraC-like DNA-binding protein
VTLTGYPEVAAFVGLDPYQMLGRTRISPEMMADLENRIPAQAVIKLLEDSAHASGCMTFGLAMAECRTFASLGPISLLLEHLGSTREIVTALTDYRRHLNDVINLGVQEIEEEEVLQIELLASFATPQAADLAIGVAFVALTGASRFRWRPLAVHFSHSAPRDCAPYKRFFGLPVEFQCAFNGFSCTRESMESKWSWANETMAEHARRLLSLVELAPETAPVSESVMRIIGLSLPSGRATLPDIAAQIGKSPRSLQRSLADEGHSFGGLLNQVRRSIVIQQLSLSNSSLTWIAAMLGYFSSSSFSRWFISEFGVPPRVWRAEQLRAIGSNVI